MGFVRRWHFKGQTIYVNTCPKMSQSLRNSVLYGLIMGQLSLFREQNGTCIVMVSSAYALQA